MNRIVHLAHDLTHRVPGVPEHSAARPSQSLAAHQRRHREPHVNPRHQAPPRVLVEWQNRISDLVSGAGRKERGSDE